MARYGKFSGPSRRIHWDGERDSVKEALTYELQLRQLGTTSAYRIEHEQLTNHRAEAGAEEISRAPASPRCHLRFSRAHDVHVDQQAALRQAAVARMQRRVAADGQNLIPVIHTLYTGDREFKKVVDDSMRVAFGEDYQELVFPPAADQRVQLRVRWKSLRTEQSTADLSDGTVRFLLLLAILSNPAPGNLIAIDEPEVSLHPSMFPIIAELAADAAERTQVILTTHSPQFLDAFAGEPPTVTVTQWMNGETHLSIVDGDELRRWLREYSLGALFRTGELEGMA